MYHSLSYASRKHYNGFANILFWLLQAWGEAYFPNADTMINVSKDQEPTVPMPIIEYIEYFARNGNF